MGGVILRTAGGTLLFVFLLWLVRIDDYRVAGMMLTFPMLNGIGLLGAGLHAERQVKATLPVIVLNGLMCFVFVSALVVSQSARANPAAVTGLAVTAWLGVYALLESRGIAFARSSPMTAFAIGAAAAAVGVTYWMWPGCSTASVQAVIRAGGLAGVMEGWVTILMFAASLAIFFWFARKYQDSHAAIGRLAALPMVPLFGLYTVATLLRPDPAALTNLETLQSMVLIGWTFAMLFAVVFARYVVRATSAGSSTLAMAAVLIAGWAICLACILASAKVAPIIAGCTSNS